MKQDVISDGTQRTRSENSHMPGTVGTLSQDRIIDIELTPESELPSSGKAVTNSRRRSEDSWLPPSQLGLQRAASVTSHEPAPSDVYARLFELVRELQTDARDGWGQRDAILQLLESERKERQGFETKIIELQSDIRRIQDFLSSHSLHESKSVSDKGGNRLESVLTRLVELMRKDMSSLESRITQAITNSEASELQLDPKQLQENLQTIYGVVKTGVQEGRAASEVIDSRLNLVMSHMRSLQASQEVDSIVEEVQIASAALSDIAAEMRSFKRKVYLAQVGSSVLVLAAIVTSLFLS